MSHSDDVAASSAANSALRKEPAQAGGHAGQAERSARLVHALGCCASAAGLAACSWAQPAPGHPWERRGAAPCSPASAPMREERVPDRGGTPPSEPELPPLAAAAAELAPSAGSPFPAELGAVMGCAWGTGPGWGPGWGAQAGGSGGCRRRSWLRARRGAPVDQQSAQRCALPSGCRGGLRSGPREAKACPDRARDGYRAGQRARGQLRQSRMIGQEEVMLEEEGLLGDTDWCPWPPRGSITNGKPTQRWPTRFQSLRGDRCIPHQTAGGTGNTGARAGESLVERSSPRAPSLGWSLSRPYSPTP